MVDLRATNKKLTHRSCRIVSELAEVDSKQAEALLAECDGEVKTAIVAHRRGLAPEVARKLLDVAQGHLRDALTRELP